MEFKTYDQGKWWEKLQLNIYNGVEIDHFLHLTLKGKILVSTFTFIFVLLSIWILAHIHNFYLNVIFDLIVVSSFISKNFAQRYW